MDRGRAAGLAAVQPLADLGAARGERFLEDVAQLRLARLGLQRVILRHGIEARIEGAPVDDLALVGNLVHRLANPGKRRRTARDHILPGTARPVTPGPRRLGGADRDHEFLDFRLQQGRLLRQPVGRAQHLAGRLAGLAGAPR